jgi:tRNA(adenine34) deaminase
MKKKKDNWLQNITTDSTSPPEGIFTKDAETIARVMARKDVSPLGIGSAIKMVQYFINRGGKGISPGRRVELEKAKKLLQERMKKK